MSEPCCMICNACDTGCDSCETNCESGCEWACQSCDTCQGCDYCDTCQGCDYCDTCQSCDTCQGCDYCDTCQSCDTCQGCDYCDICQSCDTCQGCDYCDTCQSCDICQGCDYCDTCQSCDTCQGCNSCDTCQSCDICQGCDSIDETDPLIMLYSTNSANTLQVRQSQVYSYTSGGQWTTTPHYSVIMYSNVDAHSAQVMNWEVNTYLGLNWSTTRPETYWAYAGFEGLHISGLGHKVYEAEYVVASGNPTGESRYTGQYVSHDECDTCNPWVNIYSTDSGDTLQVRQSQVYSYTSGGQWTTTPHYSVTMYSNIDAHSSQVMNWEVNTYLGLNWSITRPETYWAYAGFEGLHISGLGHKVYEAEYVVASGNPTGERRYTGQYVTYDECDTCNRWVVLYSTNSSTTKQVRTSQVASETEGGEWTTIPHTLITVYHKRTGHPLGIWNYDLINYPDYATTLPTEPPILGTVNLFTSIQTSEGGQSISISGSCSNAHHTSLHIIGNGVDIWRDYTGTSFNDIFVPSVTGIYSFQLYARNTANDDDYMSQQNLSEVMTVTIATPIALEVNQVNYITPSGYMVDKTSGTINILGKGMSHVDVKINYPDGSMQDFHSQGNETTQTMEFTAPTVGSYEFTVQASSLDGRIVLLEKMLEILYTIVRNYIKLKDYRLRDNHINYNIITAKVTICGIDIDIVGLLGAGDGYTFATPASIDQAFNYTFSNGINNIIKRYNLMQLKGMYPSDFDFNLNVNDNNWDDYLNICMNSFATRFGVTGDTDQLSEYLQEAIEGIRLIPGTGGGTGTADAWRNKIVEEATWWCSDANQITYHSESESATHSRVRYLDRSTRPSPDWMDCSEFVASIYYTVFNRALNIGSICGFNQSYPNETQELRGSRISSISGLKSGDLMFFDWDSNPCEDGIDHVGIYIGKDAEGYDLIAEEHGSNSNGGRTEVRRLSQYQRDHFVEGSRIIQDDNTYINKPAEGKKALPGSGTTPPPTNGTVYAIACTTSGEHYVEFTEEKQNANALYIYNYYAERGWSKNAICALLGNIQQESQMNPGAWQHWHETGAGDGYGLVQWTPAEDKFLKWMGFTGDDKADLADAMATNDPKQFIDKQLEFLLLNMNLISGTPGYGGEWIQRTDGNYYSPYPMTASDFIVSNNDLGELTRVFHSHFERSGDTWNVIEDRMEYAQNWYNYLTELGK